MKINGRLGATCRAGAHRMADSKGRVAQTRVGLPGWTLSVPVLFRSYWRMLQFPRVDLQQPALTFLQQFTANGDWFRDKLT